MQNLLELATLAAFVVVYYLQGIYAATAALMVATGVVLVVDLAWSRRIPMRHGAGAVLVFALGTATLLMHNVRYLQWKPTVFFWLASAAFLGSFWIGRRPLVATLLGKALDPGTRVPDRVWRRLNALWVLFYAALGAANLLVAYHASERTWVNFKVFGLTAATAAFIFIQALWLSGRAAEGAPAADAVAPAERPESAASG